MKKSRVINILLSFFLVCNFLSAESKEVADANRRTANRCLNLAEKCMLGDDWQNAYNQTELGLAYDDSISDLHYIKALAQSNMNYKRRDVLNTIERAFELGNWINYNENGARVLYADVLSEIGQYDKSLEILDSKPFIYTADAEFIRIKNYYRMGTVDAIQQARVKLNNSRKIYPADKRFPQLFFYFEMNFMNYAEQNVTGFELPEIVQTIAESYIVNLPDYENQDVDTEIIALMFTKGEQQVRLLKAIGEKNQNTPLFALAGLKTGILSEEKAYNLFFDASNDVYYLNILESFVKLIKNEGLKKNLYDLLKSFTGTLYVDEDLDLRHELKITYERGRATSVSFDVDNDDILDLYAECDFGTPFYIKLENINVDLTYDIYPSVNKVANKTTKTNFYFLNSEFNFEPFEMIADKVFANLNVSFFIPYINQEIVFPDDFMLVDKAACIEIPTAERDNSKVAYTVFEGRPVFASFSNNYEKYAYATIEPGCPFIRYLDSDSDGYYETAETYDIDSQSYFNSNENQQLIKNIFGENTFSSTLFLSKIEIDRNKNTIKEFKEEYLPNNGKITYWDNDDNGIWDCEYMRYPDNYSSEIIEKSTFIDKNGENIITLELRAEKPVSILYHGKENPVVKGYKENYYWIGEKGDSEQEDKIASTIGINPVNGEIKFIEYNQTERLLAIRIDESIYCRVVPAFEEEIENENE